MLTDDNSLYCYNYEQPCACRALQKPLKKFSIVVLVTV